MKRFETDGAAVELMHVGLVDGGGATRVEGNGGVSYYAKETRVDVDRLGQRVSMGTRARR